MAVREHPMTMTGFCQHPSPGSHSYCQSLGRPCMCGCHSNPAAFDDGLPFGAPRELVVVDT